MPRLARRIGPALSTLVIAAGCVSKPALVPQTYAIDPPAAAAPAGSRVLSLSRVDVSPPYGGSSFVYRSGEHGIERDPYASWAVSPGWMLTSAIRGYLKNAPFVRDVVSPGDGVPASATIEAHATELYAELGNPAAAVLTLQFRVVTAPGAASPARELMLKTYTERVPLPERKAAAAAAAWNTALAGIMKSFETDLQAALPPP